MVQYAGVSFSGGLVSAACLLREKLDATDFTVLSQSPEFGNELESVNIKISASVRTHNVISA